jgi:hypothetical protein
MNPPNIYQKVDEAYQNNRQRLIEFFLSHGFDEQQSEQLTASMKQAVFFLETHEYERGDIEIQLRKEIKTALKKEAEALKKAKPTIEQLVPQFNWDEIFELRLEQIKTHEFNKTRAGKNKSLELALYPLFWRLNNFGKGQTEEVNIVYDLFVTFDLDDYGKIYSTNEIQIGEKEQKERIRKQFQQKAFKAKDYYSKLGLI